MTILLVYRVYKVYRNLGFSHLIYKTIMNLTTETQRMHKDLKELNIMSFQTVDRSEKS
jgi:hypothetical protein